MLVTDVHLAPSGKKMVQFEKENFYFVLFNFNSMDSKILAQLRKARGFTLIELLIVIAIIAILSVAFLPTLRGGQAGARNAARKSAANDIVLGVEKIINNDGLPSGLTGGSVPVSAGECLSFNVAGNGLNIAKALGTSPAVQAHASTNGFCSSGYYYRSYRPDGNPSVAGDSGANAPTNYIVAVKVEQPVSNGNVTDGTLSTPADGSSVTQTNVNTAFPTFNDAITKTGGTPNSLLWVITK